MLLSHKPLSTSARETHGAHKPRFTPEETLKRYGHDPREFKQIEQCANKSVYVLDYKESVPIEKALELLGRETFLSGISRSAFHWTTARETPDGKHSVHFESGTCSPFREKA